MIKKLAEQIAETTIGSDPLENEYKFQLSMYSVLRSLYLGHNLLADDLYQMMRLLLTHAYHKQRLTIALNAYERAIMMSEEEIVKIALGKYSNIIVVTDDTVRVGLILAVIKNRFNASPQEVLEETLLYAKNVV